MWLPSADVVSAGGEIRIRHGGDPGGEHRLAAAFLRWDRARGAPAGSAAFSGLAWRDRDGTTSWGWPDAAGRVELRPSAGRAGPSSLLPLAMSLALALRRGGVDLGAPALVLGEGIAARIARSVAQALGCRVRRDAPVREPVDGVDATSEQSPESSHAPIVIETSGAPDGFGRAVARCSDWGTVLWLGQALTSAPFDYYADVHRRALRVTHVPDRPVLLAGDEEIVARGGALLLDALQGLRPDPCEVVRVLILPDDAPARLLVEAGGWGLLESEER